MPMPDTKPDVAIAAKTEDLTLSVVITSHNYGAFVGDAIRSALALRWPRVEVIVVDDGSTDGSPEIIRGFGPAVRMIETPHVGPSGACSAGFAACTGDVVSFLDADDMLHPDLMREVARVWRPGVSKVQCQMATVGRDGRPLGTVFPQFPPGLTPERIRGMLLTSYAYPTPPGSANVYARWFLDGVMPHPETLDGLRVGNDTMLLGMAVMSGDVVTIPKPLVFYRIHGANLSVASDVGAGALVRRIRIDQANLKRLRAKAADLGYTLPAGALERSPNHLQYRIACHRLFRDEHPVAEDRTAGLLAHMARAVLAFDGMSAKGKAVLLMWSAGVLLGPKPLARRLVRWRFSPMARPRLLRRALAATGVLTRLAPRPGTGDAAS
ncbi:MAG TPA: glycosyltransferase family 2 protein [Azospirillum sp.]|nr:glycosyltransferase family 2 protein [Azospirillum sp.]